ncbi:MAG TPA: sigma-70 family RNA polymerase sigma factor [Thermoanaerobaculia bacterium]
MPNTADVTELLVNWSRGDKAALDRLMPLIYEEMRRIAARYLRNERSEHTLQPTALVNEAYMRLVGQKDVSWQNRAHFLGVSAEIMRRILVDHARRRQAEKRGGGVDLVTLDDQIDWPDQKDLSLLALDDALTLLSELDPQQSKVVELRFFGGLSVEETGEALGISATTVKREWRMARAWLLRQLQPSSDS